MARSVEVVGEVVAVGVGVDLDRVVVLDQPVGVVEVGEPVEEPVEAVEAALAGPGVAGPGVGLVGVLGQVPLAHHAGGVAGVAQQSRPGWRRRRRAPWRSRGSRGRSGRRCRPRRVRVEAGEQRGPGGRAHRGGVEVGVLQAPRRPARRRWASGSRSRSSRGRRSRGRRRAPRRCWALPRGASVGGPPRLRGGVHPADRSLMAGVGGVGIVGHGRRPYRAGSTGPGPVGAARRAMFTRRSGCGQRRFSSGRDDRVP